MIHRAQEPRRFRGFWGWHQRDSGERLLGFAYGRLLPLSRGLSRLVAGWRLDRELARGLFGPGACRSGRTGATGGLGKAAAHDSIAGDITA